MKTTYLLGAGASYNALPIINEFHDVMLKIHKLFKNIIANNRIIDETIDKNLNNIYITLCESIETKEFLIYFNNQLEFYIQKLKNFSTIDSYAKYLYINKNKNGIIEYNKYKLFVSIFFILFQDHFYNFLKKINKNDKEYQKNDLRYSDFLVNLLTEDQLPNNLKILSWNYDFQFQYALKDFFSQEFDKYDLISPFPTGFFNRNLNTNFLYQLNGIANHKLVAKSHYTFDIEEKNATKKDNKFTFIKNIFFQYHSHNTLFEFNNNSPISYAWENELSEIFKNKVDITEHLEETTHLIIIGYSFPFTNRKIDKEIFKYLDHNKIESIVFQNPNINFDVDILFNYFKGQVSKNLVDKFKHIKECDNFYIPYEYEYL
jgi:hypothetical protein